MNLSRKAIHETSPPPSEASSVNDSNRGMLAAVGAACALPLSLFAFSEGSRHLAGRFIDQFSSTFCSKPPHIRSISDFCGSAQVSGDQLCLTNVPCVGLHLGFQPIGHEFIAPYPSRVTLEAFLCSRTIDSEGGYSYQLGSSMQDCSFTIKSKTSLAPLPFELGADRNHKAVITFAQGQEGERSGEPITIQFLTGPARGKTASAWLDHMYFEY